MNGNFTRLGTLKDLQTKIQDAIFNGAEIRREFNGQAVTAALNGEVIFRALRKGSRGAAWIIIYNSKFYAAPVYPVTL